MSQPPSSRKANYSMTTKNSTKGQSEVTKPIFITKGRKETVILHEFRITHVTAPIKDDSRIYSSSNIQNNGKDVLTVHYITEEGPGQFDINMSKELVNQLSENIKQITNNNSLNINVNPLYFAYPLPESATSWICSGCRKSVSGHNFIYTICSMSTNADVSPEYANIIYCINCAKESPTNKYNLSRMYSTIDGRTYTVANISDIPENALIYTLYQDIHTLKIYPWPVSGAKIINTMVPEQPVSFPCEKDAPIRFAYKKE